MKTTSATLLGMMLLSPLVAALPQGNIDHSLIPRSPAELEKRDPSFGNFPVYCLLEYPSTSADCRKRLCEMMAAIREDLSSEECLADVASAMSDHWKEIMSIWKDRIGRRSADIPSDQIGQYEAAKERFREQMDNMNSNMSKQSPSSSYASPPDGIYPPPVGGWGSIDWNSIDYITSIIKNSIDYITSIIKITTEASITNAPSPTIQALNSTVTSDITSITTEASPTITSTISTTPAIPYPFTRDTKTYFITPSLNPGWTRTTPTSFSTTSSIKSGWRIRSCEL